MTNNIYLYCQYYFCACIVLFVTDHRSIFNRMYQYIHTTVLKIPPAVQRTVESTTLLTFLKSDHGEYPPWLGIVQSQNMQLMSSSFVQTYSAEGQRSYESKSQPCSSFNRALTIAIENGGTMTNVTRKLGECKIHL